MASVAGYNDAEIIFDVLHYAWRSVRWSDYPHLIMDWVLFTRDPGQRPTRSKGTRIPITLVLFILELYS